MQNVLVCVFREDTQPVHYQGFVFHFKMVQTTNQTNPASFNSPHKLLFCARLQVWNFDNILEEVYAIDRHEKPIESCSLANNGFTGATLTRNCVGIWNLENGRLERMLANSAHRSV